MAVWKIGADLGVNDPEAEMAAIAADEWTARLSHDFEAEMAAIAAADEWTARLIHDFNARKASEEDRAAAAFLLGLEGRGSRLTFRSWDIPGSAGRTWHVEEREDTKNGGVYVYCPCPAWKFNGLVCKHTDRVAVNG